jgi:predicted amidohydrolase YtcJ
MFRITPITAAAALVVGAAWLPTAGAQPAVATLTGGRMTFPLEIDSNHYRVTLNEVRGRRNVYELDVGNVWSIDEPDEDTAVFSSDDGELEIPSLWTGRTLWTDVTFERIDPDRLLFRLERFRRNPDVIFFNGEILTMEDRRPQVEALAISGDTIVAMGNNRRVLAMRGRHTKLVNLWGKTLMPGFVDPHDHAFHSVFFGGTDEWHTYADVQQSLLAAGTTTLGDANFWPDILENFLPFAQSDDLHIRMSVYLGYNDACGELWPADWWKAYGPIKDPRAMFRIPGIKIFSDGGSCNSGAFSFLREAGDLYFTDKEKDPWSTELGWLPEEAIEESAAGIEAAIREATEAGYQVAIHTLGDIAVDAVQLAIANALEGRPNTPRIRMEHNRFVRPEQLPRYGEIGAIPVVFGQPYTCPILYNGPWSFLQNVPVLQPWLDPWRALIDANPGLTIAWKTDAIAFFPYQPLTHLWSLVTRNEYGYDRQTPDANNYVSPPPDVLCEAPDWLKANAVTVDEALHMMTINAAYALFMERKVGSLRPGKFADMIVLSDNPRTVEPNDIVDIDVLMTMVGGEVEHCAAGSEALCP